MDFSVIIPARYASSRLPAKLLQDIHGKPLIQHTFENAVNSGASRVIIATDDQRIESIATEFGASTCMTG
ncbi:MAG: CMP-2-keto-3-deoxyoctulosonic acid synthetase [uncultured Candidatus Thioglobus sp.]|nr:MAG: CMP-2-keto-3-deoxyoctulosonic acid synthetase [uncultured Candidatus Thioglobus sp.]